ncbi:MAG: hypothetical protein JW973_06765 [Bacteroidales bacterium]|nr:hypothetical protein [Bacteroidales bacterium]
MLALSEMLKTFSPLKRLASKNSPLRKQIVEKLIDLVLIVISIYLALSFEGLAEKRKEHKKLKQYYVNFCDEIVKDTISLSKVMTHTDILQKSIKIHIDLLQQYDPSLQDTLTTLFQGMLSGHLFYSSSMISYKAMVLSGDIKLIEKMKVKEKLLELEEDYNGIKLLEDFYLDFYRKKLFPAVTENFDMLEQKLTVKDYYTLQQHRNLVVELYSVNSQRQGQYKAAMEKARETLVVLKHELDK